MAQLEYFYGREAEQFAFFTVPKVLFTDPDYKDLPCEAKMLYQWTKGFNDEAKDLIRQSLQKPEPVVVPTQPNAMQKFMQGRLKHMEIWQKSFENGEYLRSVESGTEANYDMIDGRVNNTKKEPEQDKPKKRTSVIKRLRQKQVAIAVRDGKPVPKYLQQAAAQERNRR